MSSMPGGRDARTVARRDDRGRRARRRGGAVLIIALGVLTVIAVFAVSFASLLRLEQRAAANVSDATRARLVAEAGLERAQFLLTEHELRDPIASFHAPWAYRSQDATAWGVELPLDEARSPSFRAGATPEGVTYSGVVAGTYRPLGDLFSLKVVDLSARLSLNSRQARLGDMLDALGRAVLEWDRARLAPGDPRFDQGLADSVRARRDALVATGLTVAQADAATAPVDPVGGRGAAIVARRDGPCGGRFVDLDQLAALLGPRDLEVLREYVTVDAWLDPAMVRFDAAGAEVPEWRAPVNVNTAPWPVLVACLEGIEARRRVHLDDAALGIDAATARGLATAIDQRRRGVRAGPRFRPPGGEPFRGWTDLHRWLAQDADGDGSNDLGLNATQRAALMAAANPNLVHVQRDPDGAVNHGLGKRDLLTATTELCFITYGLYEVTSLGLVLGPDGGVVARSVLVATVCVYDVLRLLTQADFEAARDSDELEKTASFPNPVRALTGEYRVQASDKEVVFEPYPDAAARQQARVAMASRSSGYVQLIADEPAEPRPPETIAGAQMGSQQAIEHTVHLFRFGADLRGELWRFRGTGQLVVLDPTASPFVWVDDPPPGRWEPNPAYASEGLEAVRLRDAAGPLFDDPLEEGATPGLRDRVQAFALASGATPPMLGLDLARPADRARWDALVALAAARFPAGAGRTRYDEELSPDGLLVRPGRPGDLRFAGRVDGRDALDDRGGLLLWFKLNVSELQTWTPLFDGWTQAGGNPYMGQGQGAGEVASWKTQVEARLVHVAGGRARLEVRTRRWSVDRGDSPAPPRLWDPDPASPLNQVDPTRAAVDAANPDAVDFNRPYFARHIALDVDEARAAEWHYLYLPWFANYHQPYVDGLAGRVLATVATDDRATFEAMGGGADRWPLPAWPAALEGRFAPGGFVDPALARPPFSEAIVDELVLDGLQLLLRPPRHGGGPYRRDRVLDLYPQPRYAALARRQRRFSAWGPDHAGSFRCTLPAFDADRVKVGRIVWTELLPERWGPKAYEAADFQSQAAWRWSTDEQNDRLSGRVTPAPSLALMSDDYVRYWRLRFIDERCAALLELEQRYQRLASGAAADAATTWSAYEATFAAERAALEQERQAILDRWGQPAPPPDGGTSIAFGADTQLTPEARRVVLRLDFLYFDKAQSASAPPVGRDGQAWWQATALNVSPILDDVIIPWQERPRLLRLREE